MNNTSSTAAPGSVGFWQNVRLMPLFATIFTGILLLFALSIGLASWFLNKSNDYLAQSNQEIQIRMAISNSSNHLRNRATECYSRRCRRTDWRNG